MVSVGVVGGGYAGIRIVRHLDRLLGSRAAITLMDRYDHHQLITRLPEVVSGSIPSSKSWIPFQAILPHRVRLLFGEITRIDLEQRCVEINGESPRQFDWLVITPGTRVDFLDVPGAAERAFPLKSVPDAERMAAALAQQKGFAVRVMIAGAGYTAVELGGELSASGISIIPRPAEVTLIAPDRRLLPEGDSRLAGVAAQVLDQRGIRLFLQDRVVQIGESAVRTGQGQVVPADVVVWAMRAMGPSSLLTDASQRPDGKVEVDPYLRVTERQRVYAAGDAAYIYDYQHDRAVPSSAQMALQEADIVAANIAAEIDGRPLTEFRPHSLGEALALGDGQGAANVAGLVVTGRLAVAGKRAALARYLAGLGGPALVARYL